MSADERALILGRIRAARGGHGANGGANGASGTHADGAYGAHAANSVSGTNAGGANRANGADATDTTDANGANGHVDRSLQPARVRLPVLAASPSKAVAITQTSSTATPANGTPRTPADPVEWFVERARARGTTVERCAGMAELPGAIARLLAAEQRGEQVRAAPDPRLRALDFAPAGVAATFGPARFTDEVGLGIAFAAVAETGSVVVTSGSTSPVSLCFVPPVHVVAVHANRIVGTFPEVWPRLREDYGTALPRSVHLISSTSMTGDIAYRLIRGAHGPLRLHVVIVDDDHRPRR